MTVSMSGGEIGPGLYARVDLARYQNSLKTCLNFIVRASGGVWNRPGTRMVAETKSSGPVRLIPFTFNNSQTYVIEAGDRCFRFYRNGAPILATVPVTDEPFGTGDGATKTFHLKHDGVNITTPRKVAVSVAGALQDVDGGDNMLTAPNDFANAAWTKGVGVTVTSNNAAAPDATQTADTLAWSA